MTLVDLPGITKVPVGDQPSDIEARIREMIHEYIQHESCVILAVHPANQDLANSDALTTARAVDPEGLRTVGVLTKLDIMDRGTDAAAALRGEVVPLRLGYVGCVNRCQADIKENVPIQAARDAESAFFRKHPAYGNVADQCGTRALAERLNGILVQHIRAQLPQLRTSLQQGLSERLMRLQALGEGAAAPRLSMVRDALLGLMRLLPMGLATGVGTETQKHFASVIEGGMVVVPLVALVLLPVIYALLGTKNKLTQEKKKKKE